MATKSAVLSGGVADLPAWMRSALVLAGLSGVVVIIVASLTGGSAQTIRVDKLLHFAGYATLGAIFALGLRPALILPALGGLALLSIAVEYLQPFNERTFDRSDMVANVVGIAVGAIIGGLLHLAGRAFARHVKDARLQRHRLTFGPGAIIAQQGAKLDRCYVIADGQVRLSRETDGRQVVLGTMTAGDVFGLLAVLQNQPQYATAEALDSTSVYALTLNELLPEHDSEPVAHVLTVLCTHVRALANRVTEVEKVVS
jgi:CRP-like cAMP-binding protein